MTTTLKKLTLVCPADLGEQLIEFLLESETLASGFTTFAADGHGHDFSHASLSERVRGRVRRIVVMVVVPEDKLPVLLGTLKENFVSPHTIYWIEPVEEFGDFK